MNLEKNGTNYNDKIIDERKKKGKERSEIFFVHFRGGNHPLSTYRHMKPVLWRGKHQNSIGKRKTFFLFYIIDLMTIISCNSCEIVHLL